MAKDVKKIEYKVCRYKIESCKLIIDGWGEHEINPGEEISFMLMEKDFEHYMNPFFEIDLTVSNKLFRIMKKNHNKIKMYINIRSALFKKDELYSKDKNPGTNYETFINDTFRVFMDDETTRIDDPIQKEVEDKTSYGDNDPNVTTYGSDTHVRLLLLRDDDISAPKELHAAVLVGGTITDIVTYLLMHLGNTKKILMSPSSNPKRYPQMKLPPIRYDEAIERICNNYGMHDNGSNLFFDFDRVYILDRTNKCTAWEPNEYKVVHVVSIPPTEDFVYRTGIYIADDEKAYYTQMKLSENLASSLTAAEFFGHSLLVIDKATGQSNVVRISGDEMKLMPKTEKLTYDRTLVINTGNRGTIEALKTRLAEQSMVWQVQLDNTMVQVLKPNREFDFIFTSTEATKYNGTYRLARFATTFSRGDRGDSEWYSTQTVATFYGKNKRSPATTTTTTAASVAAGSV